MNSKLPDITSKRKYADLNNSVSSENSSSPSPKPVSKVQKTLVTGAMVLTIEDLKQLRLDLNSDIKVELKDQLEQFISPIVAKISQLEASVEQIDRKSRSNNIIIHGVPTLANENTEALASYVEALWKKLGVAESLILDDIYRLGKPSTTGARPVMVKFLRMMDKKRVIVKRKEAAKIKIFINEDCTAQEQHQKKLLSTHLRTMKDLDATTWGSVRGNSLHVKKPGCPTRKFAVQDGRVKELNP